MPWFDQDVCSWLYIFVKVVAWMCGPPYCIRRGHFMSSLISSSGLQRLNIIHPLCPIRDTSGQSLFFIWSLPYLFILYPADYVSCSSHSPIPILSLGYIQQTVKKLGLDYLCNKCHLHHHHNDWWGDVCVSHFKMLNIYHVFDGLYGDIKLIFHTNLLLVQLPTCTPFGRGVERRFFGA